ncbi:heme-binding protein [Citricoccus sp. SGAir0253]|uniref:SOUL family heme-binding protein n=1 Tax=Citricoccus sp. SGAir0253 TaxID=2567881 RepID=UPI0010CD05E8|nr:heme-binding protein [Citricoccus sp. SGAir0253]QCU77936.1 heme-binding protein [Citricoccus sp. SGAir0253]
MTAQQPYETVRDHGTFELRRYPGHVLAEVVIEDTFERAGSRAFRLLFGYLGGRNVPGARVAMTAPVVQEPAAVPLAMTAPVLQEPASAVAGEGRASGFRVAFVLPEGLTLADAPRPTDPRVSLRSVPPGLVAARRFRGRWTRHRVRTQLQRLETAVREEGLTPVGEPRFARFDPPTTPWFLRHNEVLLSLVEPA